MIFDSFAGVFPTSGGKVPMPTLSMIVAIQNRRLTPIGWLTLGIILLLGLTIMAVSFTGSRSDDPLNTCRIKVPITLPPANPVGMYCVAVNGIGRPMYINGQLADRDSGGIVAGCSPAHPSLDAAITYRFYRMTVAKP